MTITGVRPAGRTLGYLLATGGMPTIVDSASRAHAESRARAGLLEARTVAAPARAGLAENLQRDALHHSGIGIRTGGPPTCSTWPPTPERCSGSTRSNVSSGFGAEQP